ncbi:hypothetical protein [Rhodococcus sp. UFZ-B548]|uniref:hypothetical protein n=1 Tax=Rhodococcus sp. UFZ-B548 TaxID=2742212 RepID=UPI0015F4A9C0|nr:hypothetical protein [Rhodococcus sp. UFZ-B548]
MKFPAGAGPFNVAVDVPDGVDQAESRAVRRAAQRAWARNAENAGGNLLRHPEGQSEYRVVSIGLSV